MIPFDNTYARLPDRFFARIAPTRVREPRVIAVNHALADLIGIDPAALDALATAEALSGNVVLPGSEPIALAYAGHQFGGFVPQLGDGRAILLGEVVGRDGKRRDIQLKGAGRTPFSRGGDGRAALGPVLREYVVGEAMAALGVPTTRALAAVTTGEPVMRDDVLPGAILTRVAASHLRVGTFQFFGARDDVDALRELVAYALRRHYPDAPSDEPALALLGCVLEAQAELVARWLGVGFIHGVMNTDNTSISGETIDYGPCAFLDEYDPGKTFSSIDRRGRYAYGNQPAIALWNCARLADALLPLIAPDENDAVAAATGRLESFAPIFRAAHERVVQAKLGLSRKEDDDRALGEELFELLAASEVDFTSFFRSLCRAAEDPSADATLGAMFGERAPFEAWIARWHARIDREDGSAADRATAMRAVNPAFIPRNHRIEEMIVAAVGGDFEPFETLGRALSQPYEDQPELARLAEPPRPEERVRATFCGT